jgi:hypothetical protein
MLYASELPVSRFAALYADRPPCPLSATPLKYRNFNAGRGSKRKTVLDLSGLKLLISIAQDVTQQVPIKPLRRDELLSRF